MSNLKSWLLLPVNPLLMVLHFHTQWQGLLNVLGALWFIFFLLSVAVSAGIIFCMVNNEPVPELGSATRQMSKPLLIASCIVMTGVGGYLFWTGHLVVGSIYLLASFTGYLAYAIARLHAVQQ